MRSIETVGGGAVSFEVRRFRREPQDDEADAAVERARRDRSPCRGR
jgi:hypothetical protein